MSEFDITKRCHVAHYLVHVMGAQLLPKEDKGNALVECFQINPNLILRLRYEVDPFLYNREFVISRHASWVHGNVLIGESFPEGASAELICELITEHSINLILR